MSQMMEKQKVNIGFIALSSRIQVNNNYAEMVSIN